MSHQIKCFKTEKNNKKNIRLLITCLLCLLTSLSINAQSAINASGTAANTQLMQHSYSVGEMCLVHTSSSANIIITQGLLQPTDAQTKSVVTEKLNINLYPNPSSDIVYLDFDALHNTNLQFELLDINGKVLHKSILLNLVGRQKVPVDVKNYVTGNYLLKAKISNELIEQQVNFKIQKIN